MSSEIKAQAVGYARENLVGVPYFAATGVFTKKYEKTPPKGSQCSHLVWTAYKHAGVDLDSNQGALVLPKDFLRSEYVEVVQVFGFDLEKLWI